MALDAARSYYSNERGALAARNATLQMALEYALARGLKPIKSAQGRADRKGHHRAGAYSFQASPGLYHALEDAYRAFGQSTPPLALGAFARQLIHRGLIAYNKSRSSLFEPVPLNDDSSSLSGENAAIIGFKTSEDFLRDLERARKVIEQKDGITFDVSGFQRMLLVRALTLSMPIEKSPSTPGGNPATAGIRLNPVAATRLRMAHRAYEQESGENVRIGTFARWLIHAAARRCASRRVR